MKKIKLPEENKDYIDLSAVSTSQLIIVKEDTKIKGFIIFNDEEWGFQQAANMDDTYNWNYTLNDTIKEISKIYPTYTFFVEE